MASVDDPALEQKLITYAKLQSFRKAEERITKLLSDLLNDDDVAIEQGDLGLKPSEDAIAQTGALVIDARQTRTLVTPKRRDKNVDHWDEIDKIASKDTMPPGSFLIFIYGDESSKDLEEGRVISTRWMTTWKYADTNAHSLAEKGRVFSLAENFNKTQEEKLKKYFQDIPLYPTTTNKNVNVLLLATDAGQEEVRGTLKEHPLVSETTQDTDDHPAEYQYFKFKEKPKNIPSIKIFYRDVTQPLKFCGPDDFQELSSKFLTEHLVSDKLGTKGYPKINRVLLACHCADCFQKLCIQHSEITKHVKKELKKVGIKLIGDVIPILSEHIPNRDDSILQRSRDIIMDFKKGTKEKHLKEKRLRLQDRQLPSLKMLYTYHAVQIPSSKPEHQMEKNEEGSREQQPESASDIGPDAMKDVDEPKETDHFLGGTQKSGDAESERVVTTNVEGAYTQSPQHAIVVKVPDDSSSDDDIEQDTPDDKIQEPQVRVQTAPAVTSPGEAVVYADEPGASQSPPPGQTNQEGPRTTHGGQERRDDLEGDGDGDAASGDDDADRLEKGRLVIQDSDTDESRTSESKQPQDKAQQPRRNDDDVEAGKPLSRQKHPDKREEERMCSPLQWVAIAAVIFLILVTIIFVSVFFGLEEHKFV